MFKNRRRLKLITGSFEEKIELRQRNPVLTPTGIRVKSGSAARPRAPLASSLAVFADAACSICCRALGSRASCNSKSMKNPARSLRRPEPRVTDRAQGLHRPPSGVSASESNPSARLARASMAVELIQPGPPSHPATLGGAYRLWPIRSQDSASAAVATVGLRTSSARIVPTANSTGDFTRRRTVLGSKKRFDRRIISTGFSIW